MAFERSGARVWRRANNRGSLPKQLDFETLSLSKREDINWMLPKIFIEKVRSDGEIRGQY